MGEVILKQQQGSNEIKNWTELFMNRNKSRGKIAVGILMESDELEFMQHQFYANSQVGWLKRNHIGKTNTFISPNAFDNITGTLERTAANVVQIRAIGLDIDCYTAGLDPSETEDALKQMIEAREIPEPNLVVRSGNGIQCFYGIDGGVPAKMAWLTRHIATSLVLKTSHLGSDMACIGIERVFRMPFTINEKPGKGKKFTSSNIWRSTEYDLSELYTYCEPIKHRAPVNTRSRLNFGKVPKLSEMGYKLRTLNQTRLVDFYKLIELRDGDIEKRNVMTYDFAFILALMSENEREVIVQAHKFNTNFKDPQPIKVVERTASSAYQDGRKFWKEYVDNGYTMAGLMGNNEGIIKPKKNSTIIKEQEITAEEMKHLSTLIGKEESYSRKVAKRRAQGVKARSEYEADRKSKKAQRLEKLLELKTERPEATQKELGEILGVSVPTIKKDVALLIKEGYLCVL